MDEDLWWQCASQSSKTILTRLIMTKRAVRCALLALPPMTHPALSLFPIEQSSLLLFLIAIRYARHARRRAWLPPSSMVRIRVRVVELPSRSRARGQIVELCE